MPGAITQTPLWKGAPGTGRHWLPEAQPVPTGAPPQAWPAFCQVDGVVCVVPVGVQLPPVTPAEAATAATLQGAVPLVQFPGPQVFPASAGNVVHAPGAAGWMGPSQSGFCPHGASTTSSSGTAQPSPTGALQLHEQVAGSKTGVLSPL